MLKRFLYAAAFKWHFSRRLTKSSIFYSLKTPDQNCHNKILVKCLCLSVDTNLFSKSFISTLVTISWCNVGSSGTIAPVTDMLSYTYHHKSKNGEPQWTTPQSGESWIENKENRHVVFALPPLNCTVVVHSSSRIYELSRWTIKILKFSRASDMILWIR